MLSIVYPFNPIILRQKESISKERKSKKGNKNLQKSHANPESPARPDFPARSDFPDFPAPLVFPERPGFPACPGFSGSSGVFRLTELRQPYSTDFCLIFEDFCSTITPPRR